MVMSTALVFHSKRKLLQYLASALARCDYAVKPKSHNPMVMHVKPRKNRVFRRFVLLVYVCTFSPYNTVLNNSKLITGNKNAKLCAVGRVEPVCKHFDMLL